MSLALAPDLDTARRWIMAGKVLVSESRVDKPGTRVSVAAQIRIKGKEKEFSSRAGHKLAAALDAFALEVAGKTALDLGASTGGFTDCLLQRGAAKVFAVDVGTNQLSYGLRMDPRVICLEKTHAKTLNGEIIPQPIELLTVDVSFTSLRYVLPPILPLLAVDARIVCLYKPQFELKRAHIEPGGVVRDLAAVSTDLVDFKAWLARRNLDCFGQIKSPLLGRQGNQEYLLAIRWGESASKSGD